LINIAYYELNEHKYVSVVKICSSVLLR